MCGIVGLFLKNPSLMPTLGDNLRTMLLGMTERGPDSSGFAVYGDAAPEGRNKATLYHGEANFDWPRLAGEIDRRLAPTSILSVRDSHAVITTAATMEDLTTWLFAGKSGVSMTGYGNHIEIYKGMGLPNEVADRFAS